MKKQLLFIALYFLSFLGNAQIKNSSILGVGLEFKNKVDVEDFSFKSGLESEFESITYGFENISPKIEIGTKLTVPITLYFKYPKFYLFTNFYFGNEQYEVQYFVANNASTIPTIGKVIGKEEFNRYDMNVGIAKPIHLGAKNRVTFTPGVSVFQNVGFKFINVENSTNGWYSKKSNSRDDMYLKYGAAIDLALLFQVNKSVGVGLFYPNALYWYKNLDADINANSGNNKNFDMKLWKLPEWRILFYIDGKKN